MRVRPLIAAVAVVLACVGLTACRTNVGVAARIGGDRVTESDVNSYLTSAAQPFSHTDSNTQVTTTTAPRSYVLQTLIEAKLFLRLAQLIGAPIVKIIGGPVTEQRLDAFVTEQLKGRSLTSVASSGGVKGYTTKFLTIWARATILVNVIEADPTAQTDVPKALPKLKLAVSVNPRYGTWDSKNLVFSSDGAAGVPAFVLLKSGASLTGTGLQ